MFNVSFLCLFDRKYGRAPAPFEWNIIELGLLFSAHISCIERKSFIQHSGWFYVKFVNSTIKLSCPLKFFTSRTRHKFAVEGVE